MATQTNFPTQICKRIPDTDIVITTYADRHFVVISQLNRFGTLIEAEAEDVSDGRKIYHTQILFGRRDDPLLVIYARQLIERIAEVSSKPLLLSIALDSEKRDTDTFTTILNTINDIATWS